MEIAQRRVEMVKDQAQEENLLKRLTVECVVEVLLERNCVTIRRAQVDSFERRIICIVSYMKFMILKILDYSILSLSELNLLFS